MPDSLCQQNADPIQQIGRTIQSVTGNAVSIGSSIGVDRVGSEIGNMIKRNPVPALMIGGGLGCYIGRRWGHSFS